MADTEKYPADLTHHLPYCIHCLSRSSHTRGGDLGFLGSSALADIDFYEGKTSPISLQESIDGPAGTRGRRVRTAGLPEEATSLQIAQRCNVALASRQRQRNWTPPRFGPHWSNGILGQWPLSRCVCSVCSDRESDLLEPLSGLKLGPPLAGLVVSRIGCDSVPDHRQPVQRVP